MVFPSFVFVSAYQSADTIAHQYASRAGTIWFVSSQWLHTQRSLWVQVVRDSRSSLDICFWCASTKHDDTSQNRTRLGQPGRHCHRRFRSSARSSLHIQIVLEQKPMCCTNGVAHESECVMDRRLVAHVDSEKCDCA